MTTQELEIFAAKNEWIWAKTFAKSAPHWYIVGDKIDKDFIAICTYISQEGKMVTFGKSSYCVLEVGDYKYWIMDAYRPGQKIINRTLINSLELKKVTTAYIAK